MHVGIQEAAHKVAEGPLLDIEAATAPALAMRPRSDNGAGRAGERTSTAAWSGGGGGGTLSIRSTLQGKGNPRPEASRRGLSFVNGLSEPALSVARSGQAEGEPHGLNKYSYSRCYVASDAEHLAAPEGFDAPQDGCAGQNEFEERGGETAVERQQGVGARLVPAQAQAVSAQGRPVRCNLPEVWALREGLEGILREAGEPNVWERIIDGVKEVWSQNHKPATDNMEIFHKKVEEEKRKGRMLEMTYKEVKKRFKNRLAVASLGLVQEGGEKWRLVHDGTRVIKVHNRIKQRDKVLQACIKGAEVPETIGPGELILVNTCGTYGIGSAAYGWGRLGAAVQRPIHYLLVAPLETWLALFADDAQNDLMVVQALREHADVPPICDVCNTPCKMYARCNFCRLGPVMHHGRCCWWNLGERRRRAQEARVASDADWLEQNMRCHDNAQQEYEERDAW